MKLQNTLLAPQPAGIPPMVSLCVCVCCKGLGPTHGQFSLAHYWRWLWRWPWL